MLWGGGEDSKRVGAVAGAVAGVVAGVVAGAVVSWEKTRYLCWLMEMKTKSHPSILIAGLALAALTALSVQAHTVLSSSVPADNAVETVAPERITLSFSTEVRLTGLSMEDAAGASVDLGSIPTATQREFVIPAPKLPPGTYRVSWRAVGADSHVVSGEYRFEVAELLSSE